MIDRIRPDETSGRLHTTIIPKFGFSSSSVSSKNEVSIMKLIAQNVLPDARRKSIVNVCICINIITPPESANSTDLSVYTHIRP